MKRCELKKLEKITFDEDIPLLDELYVVVSNRRHESGYKTYKVYGVAHGDKRKIVQGWIYYGKLHRQAEEKEIFGFAGYRGGQAGFLFRAA